MPTLAPTKGCFDKAGARTSVPRHLRWLGALCGGRPNLSGYGPLASGGVQGASSLFSVTRASEASL